MPIFKVLSGDKTGWIRSQNDQEPLAPGRKMYASLATLVHDADHEVLEAADGKIVAPLEAQARIVCIGLNYRAHAEESGANIPAHPVVFYRTRESLVGPDEPMVLPRESERLDWEGELALVIGEGGRRIPEDAAMNHVLGFTCLNDGSVRDWQKHTSQFSPGKNFDRSGAIGPAIVESKDAGDVAKMRLKTTLNGEVVQDSGVDDLIYGVPELIAYVSSFMELRTGDVIATGTPSGVGGARKPPRFMAEGDEVSIEVSGVGTLRNHIVAG